MEGAFRKSGKTSVESRAYEKKSTLETVANVVYSRSNASRSIQGFFAKSHDLGHGLRSVIQTDTQPCPDRKGCEGQAEAKHGCQQYKMCSISLSLRCRLHRPATKDQYGNI
jgi:hypothetical protein